MPVHPERVISRAVKAGLSATIVLQRAISNRVTRKYYDRSHERWSIRQQVFQITKERGTPDFSHISKAEAPTRNDARLMFYEKAAKYGFTEVSRQKNSDDTVGSLNQRFNACGAVVRENSEIMFPHPDPVSFGMYTRRDGKGRKKYRRAGYEESSFGPKVILAHPDLPSLDFGDAVRSHNEYLATFCAIHGVSVRETTRYSHLFYLLVRPYLEHLYSEFNIGKANFQKGVNWALCQVKELILEAGYQPTVYEKRTVTKELEFNKSMNKKENKRFFKNQEREAREFYGDHAAVVELGRLRGKLGDDEEKNRSSEVDSKEDDDTIFSVNDVDHIRNEVAKRARIAGSIMHRRIADLFPSPWNLNDVIYSGDRYVRSSNYIIIAEVPLQTSYGTGKVDLILCERTISDDGKRVFWKPVFVLEIKTRLGQSWYIDANYKESEVRPEGSPLQRIVSDFPLSDYLLGDDLWDAIVKSTPTSIAQKQLNIYCQALGENYKGATQQELGHILRGVVVIESTSDITEVRSLIELLIAHAYENVKNRTHRLKRTVFTPSESDNSRIALVIDEQPRPRRKDENMTKATWGPAYTPFKTKKKTKREFLLYLTGHSPTSAGQSAAWNARYYHGLQFIHEMKRTQDSTAFVWIDLASQFNEPRLAEARLRLRPRDYSEEMVAKVQPDHIREFFESIDVKGYLDDVLSFLYKDGKAPSFDLRNKKNEGKVIIITGADTLRDATPTSHRERLSILLDNLLSSLPDNENTTIVWFDAPAPSIEKTIPYSTRALIPYYEISPLGDVLTEIIWNLPVAPKGAVQPDKWGLPIIGDAPMHDDIRVILRHSPTDLQIELTHVPFLRGWSRRFRNMGTGRVIREREIDDIVPEKQTRDRMKLLSLTILPWLVRLWPQKSLVEDSKVLLEGQITQLEREFRGGAESLTVTKTVLKESPSNSPSLLDLVKFRLPETMDAQSYQTMTAGKINSQRLYRSPRKLQSKPLQRVPSPLPTQEVPAIEEELEQEWLFGVKFESEGDDSLPWWIVVQDPAHPSRMLVGCFIDRPPDKDGFLWAESKHEMLTQSSLDEILSFSQTIIIGRKTEDWLELWTSNDGEEQVYTGVLEFRGQGRSTIGHLRAIRQTFTEEPENRPSSNIRPSESFYKRTIDSLRRQLKATTSPTPVTIRLEMVDDACCVNLQDDESDVIQDISIEYTADLISLLRWPTVKGGPMFIDSGEYVTWSIFDDIEYGELDFIRPYITYTAARKAPAELPKRVSQFFDQSEDLSVSIEHDASVCPIALNDGVDHGTCWRIILPSNCPVRVREQLSRALTSEEVNGLLAPGRLYAGKLYTFDFTLPSVSEKDESIVFHEDRYIRIFLRGMGLFLKSLEPGTYLRVAVQEWYIDITWDGRSYLKWTAQSTESGLFFTGGGRRTIKLVHGRGVDEECGRMLESITSSIPEEDIANYSELEEWVKSGLRKLGYSGSSPPCDLRVLESTMEVFRYGVYLTGDNDSTPLETGFIQVTCGTTPDAILENMDNGLSDGDLSHYSIRNETSFKKKLATWVQKYVPVTAEDWSKEEDAEQEKEWEISLYVTTGMREVSWEATQKDNDEYMEGNLNVDEKILVYGDIEEAELEVREAFEDEVVPELVNVTNLEEVLEKQVPAVVREIRSQ